MHSWRSTMLILFGAAVVMGGCVTREVPITLTADEWSRAQDALKAQLRDPDSAQFKDVVAFRASDLVRVCGMVNARNGFGGYVGFQRFAVMLTDGTVGDLATTSPAQVLIQCGAEGLPDNSATMHMPLPSYNEQVPMMSGMK